MIFYFLSFFNLSLHCFLSCSYFLAQSQPGVSYKGCAYKKKWITITFLISTWVVTRLFPVFRASSCVTGALGVGVSPLKTLS